MTLASECIHRRTVLRTIVGSAVVSGTLTGVASANPSCVDRVSSGASIQAAVDSASPGDTICVKTGTYDERVTASVENLTLSGPNVGISGSEDRRNNEAIITDGVEINANGVTVDGFQIEREGPSGVRFENAVNNATIRHNVITNISGETFPHPDGNRGTGTGVQIELTGSTDETANGIDIRDNKFSDITTSNLEPGDDKSLAIGVNVLPRGNDVQNLVIDANEFTEIEPGEAGASASSRARAVSVDTQLDGDQGRGAADGIEITNNDISGLHADRLFAIAMFEDESVKPHRGVQDFLIEGNDFDNFTTVTPIKAAIFIGGYEELGSDHTVTLNTIEDGYVERFAVNQIGFTPGQEDELSAECNWWGHRTGPYDENNLQGKSRGVFGPVNYRPWAVRKFGRVENPETSCIGGIRDGTEPSD